jgi:carbonic anhydrase
VAALTPAVNSVQGAPGDLLANATRRNVSMNVDKLKASTPILKPFNDEKKIHVVGAIYQLKSGRVELLT